MVYYRSIANNIALHRLQRPIATPDYRLMVGEAEKLSPLPLLLYRDVPTKQAKALIPPAKRENVDIPLQGTTYTTDDFVNNTFWLGAPIVGG